MGHWTIFKPTDGTSIPSAPFQNMQSSESSNGFFPFNAYFYPPTSNAGFASVASSSILEPATPNFEFNEATKFPSHPQQHHPSAYYPDNFLPPQFISSSSIPPAVVVPSEVGQCYPSAYNLPLQSFSVEHPQVTPGSPSDNTRRRRSVKPSAKPSVRKTRVRNRERLNEEGRIKLLQGDEYIMSFGATWVTCSGCRKRIKLDSRKRARYYPGFWVKHKGICPGVTEKMVRILSFSQKFVY